MFERGEAFVFHDFDHAGAGADAAGDGAILSPMPGRIVAAPVAVGDVVIKGQPLVTLEAMKMEHVLTAPFEGTVDMMSACVGDQVVEGVVLVRLSAKAD